MSTSGNKNMLGTRQEVRIEEEWTIPLPAIVSVSGNVITFAATSLSNPGITVNMLAGQEIWVLDNLLHSTTWKGQVFHVVSNTTFTITIEEVVEGASKWSNLPTANDLGDLADRMVVTQRGIRPGRVDISMYDYLGALGATGTGDFTVYTVDTLYGNIDESELPDPVHQGEEKYVHGSPNMPRRNQYIFNTTEYDAPWSWEAVWGRYLYPCFGMVIDQATAAFAQADAITMDVYPGDMLIEVADTTGYTVGKYIELGNHSGTFNTGTDNEIRQIVNVPLAGYLVVDKPFRRVHAVAAAMQIGEVAATCYERAFSSANGIKHTMTIADSLPYYTFAVKKKGLFDDNTQQDWSLSYLGHVFPEMTWTSDNASTVTVDTPSKGLYAELDESGWTMAAISRTFYYDSSSNALEPIHFSRGYVTVEGTRYHQIEKFDVSMSIDVDTKYVHTYNEKSSGTAGDGLKGGKEPWIHIPGRRSLTFSVDIPLHNKRIWNLIRQRSLVDFSAVYEMIRSATFTETWTWTMTNCPMTEGKTMLPSTPTESQSISPPPENVTLTITDKTPYY